MYWAVTTRQEREMEFSVLDKQTIQCVMTEAEIADYGMDKKTIYQNGKRAVDFFKQVMRRAEQETGFIKRGNSIAVHAAFLSDESLEITFSVVLDEEGQADVGKETEERLEELEEKAKQAEQTAAQMEVAVLKTKSLLHMIEFCKAAPRGLKASLYEYQGSYFLLADVREHGVHDTAVLFYTADEYMDGICYTKSIAAFILEHGTCIAREHAVEILSAVRRD